MKIIHRAIHTDQDNKKEILTMNGVEIMADIMNYILDNSFKAENKAMENNIFSHNPMQTIEEREHDDSRTYDTPMTKKKETDDITIQVKTERLSSIQEEGGDQDAQQSKERITIDRIEAKTLNLAVESTTTLLNEDIQAFVDLPLEQRIRIFTQMSQILELSFSLFPLFKRR